jgi:hypothetical protein
VGQDVVQQPAGLAQPLVVAGLVGQIGEQVAKPAVAEPQPAVLAVAAEQDLGHGQTDQLGIRQARLAAPMPAAWVGPQQLVDGDVQCNDEVVETGAHGASLEVDVASTRQLSAASSHLSLLDASLRFGIDHLAA